ncbi:hypothetical protein DFJ74DRAFT_477568 [Hyaloraphidium curvatum]|nr:hypothetical protein DFJ74DRAFT_477568 [Hyaloraphidium curvatum]
MHPSRPRTFAESSGSSSSGATLSSTRGYFAALWFHCLWSDPLSQRWVMSRNTPQQSIGQSRAILVPKNSGGDFPDPDFSSFRTSEADASVTFSESQASAAQAGFVDVRVSASYGFVDASVGVSLSQSSSQSSSSSTTRAVANWRLKRLVLQLDPASASSAFVVNPAFVRDVEGIRNQGISNVEKFRQYMALQDNWGHAFPTRVELGGKLTTSFALSTSASTTDSSVSRQISAEVGVTLGRVSARVGVTTGSSSSTSSASSSYLQNSRWTAVGGTSSLVSGAIDASGNLAGFADWARSVDDSPLRWAVTSLDAFVPVHRLLAPGLRDQVQQWATDFARAFPPAPPSGFDGWTLMPGWCLTAYLFGAPNDMKVWEGQRGVMNYGTQTSEEGCRALCEADPVCWAYTWVPQGNGGWSLNCQGRAADLETVSNGKWRYDHTLQSSPNVHMSGYKKYKDEFVRLNPGAVDGRGQRMELHWFPYVFAGTGNRFGTCACGQCFNLGRTSSYEACSQLCLAFNNNGGPVKCRAINWVIPAGNGWDGMCMMGTCEAVRLPNVYTVQTNNFIAGYPKRFEQISTTPPAEVHICDAEGGSRTETLRCPAGQAISIVQAIFGRYPGSAGDQKCRVGPMRPCAPDPNALAYRNNFASCSGRNTCDVTSIGLPDGCPGSTKHLSITFTCFVP